MICALTRVLPGDVLSVVIVGQPTRRRATFGISRYMGEILRHFSKDTSAVYFWPLSTAEGDPRGANSQLLSHSHESLFMLQYVHSFFLIASPVQLGLTRIFRLGSITRTAAKWRRGISELI